MEVSSGVRPGLGDGASPVGGASPSGVRKRSPQQQEPQKTSGPEKENPAASTFDTALQPFVSQDTARPGSRARLSAEALALLQQVDESGLPPLGPQLPPLGETPKRPDTATDTEESEETPTQAVAPEAVASQVTVPDPVPLNPQALYSYRSNLLIAEAAQAARTYVETLDSRTGAATELVA